MNKSNKSIMRIIGGVLAALFFINMFLKSDNNSGNITYPIIIIIIIVNIIVRIYKKQAAKTSENSAKVNLTRKGKNPAAVMNDVINSEYKTHKNSSHKKITITDVKNILNEKISAMPEPEQPDIMYTLVIRLKQLNDERLPFIITDGVDEGVDLIARWEHNNIKSKTNSINSGEDYCIIMKFDEYKEVVKTKNRMLPRRINELPHIEMSTYNDKHQSYESEKKVSFEEHKTHNAGIDFENDFDVKIMHHAIRTVIEKCGWKLKKVIKL